MKRSNLLFAAIALFVFLPNVCAQDWPNYLGPNRNSTSSQKGLLRTWPAAGPEVLWTASVGPGYGGPVVKAGKVYLLDRDDKTGDIMRCFEFSTGKELWSYSYDAPGTVSYPGSRSIPAIDGNRIYSCGPYGDLYCIDVNTHKPLWNKNIMKDFGGTKIPVWAITQSPLVYGDLIIVSYSQNPMAGLVAFNKMTGKIVWKTEAIGNETYASPSIVKISGEDHLVMIFSSTNTYMHKEADKSKGRILGLKPQTGKILWEYNEWENMIQVAPAFDAGEGRVLAVGGYELGTAMIKVGKNADGSYSVKELFRHNDFGDHTKPPIMYNGYFYAQFSTNDRRDGLCCMDMDGKVMWKTMRKPSFDKGSMILADGLILATDGNKTLYLIQPDPAGFKPLASAELLRMGQNWGPMALVDGKLLLRDQSRLICVKIAK
jgi:outer membrane protein assembly factor BamB